LSNARFHTGPWFPAKWRRLVYLAFLFFFMQQKSVAQAPSARAEQVKAAFIFHFTQFIKWPEDRFNAPAAPFVIGILGSDPFGSYLDKLLKGEKVNGHPIAVHRFANETEIGNCNILFVNKTATPDTLTALHKRGTLTVSDWTDFMNNGGMVRFFQEQNKVRFEINLSAAKEARLEISSKLLRLARIFEK
jgi:hypothetical protein